MTEGVLFDIAKNLLESLGQSAFQEVSSWWGARSDLKKLERTLRMIKARVIDAEKRHEEENSAAIKEWLCRLRAVFYKADDLFDDVFTAEQRKRHMQGNMAMKVQKPQKRFQAQFDISRNFASRTGVGTVKYPQLKTRCQQQPDGEDWPLVQHIPSVDS